MGYNSSLKVSLHFTIFLSALPLSVHRLHLWNAPLSRMHLLFTEAHLHRVHFSLSSECTSMCCCGFLSVHLTSWSAHSPSVLLLSAGVHIHQAHSSSLLERMSSEHHCSFLLGNSLPLKHLLYRAHKLQHASDYGVPTSAKHGSAEHYHCRVLTSMERYLCDTLVYQVCSVCEAPTL